MSQFDRRNQVRSIADTDCVAVVSGGLDSTTMLYQLVKDENVPYVVSFDYGQRHAKELEYARWNASNLKLPHTIVNLRWLSPVFNMAGSTSSLVGGSDVPEGHYAQDNMKATVVPNRNMIMLSIAAGLAVSSGAEFVATAVHAGDHFIYPDCRPDFITALDAAILIGNEGFDGFHRGMIQKKKPEGFGGASGEHFPLPESGLNEYGALYTPYLNKTKADIAYRAFELGVPINMTWSCYKGGEIHCGRCGTCVERLEAIADAHQVLAENDIPFLSDDTGYEDDEYWKTVTNANAE